MAERRGGMKQKFLDYIEEFGPQTARAIADGIGCSPEYVRKTAARCQIALPHAPSGPIGQSGYQKLKAENETLKARVAELHRALAFAQSVIKCGESWTDECENRIGAALKGENDG